MTEVLSSLLTNQYGQQLCPLVYDSYAIEINSIDYYPLIGCIIINVCCISPHRQL